MGGVEVGVWMDLELRHGWLQVTWNLIRESKGGGVERTGRL